MSLSLRTRALAVAAAVAALLPLAAVAPASAAETGAPTCQTLLAGPTPSAEVDTNGDGNPELRLPSVTDVGICVGADVVLTESPTIEREQCGGLGSCMAFHISYGLSGYVDTSVTFCYTIDGHANCGQTNIRPIPLDVIQGGRMCVGYDLRGGFPCSNGQLIAFE
jgi:hypothetical protein